MERLHIPRENVLMQKWCHEWRRSFALASSYVETRWKALTIFSRYRSDPRAVSIVIGITSMHFKAFNACQSTSEWLYVATYQVYDLVNLI